MAKTKIFILTPAIFFGKRPLAFGLILCLLCQGLPLPATAQTLESAAAAAEGLSIGTQKLQLPPEFGSIQSTYFPDAANPGTFVIHIQDAHANQDAQKNIRNILHFFYENRNDGQPIRIGLEGAAGPIHADYLDLFPEYPDVNQAIVDKLSGLGEITGAELFAWEIQKKKHAPDISLFGVEDLDLYRQNLKAYRDLLELQPEVEALLATAQQAFEIAKSHLFSPDLRRFTQERSRRKYGDYGLGFAITGQHEPEPQLLVYVDYIKKESLEILGIDLEDPLEQVRFPQLVRILKLKSLHETLDQPLAETQLKDIVAMLRPNIQTEEQKLFLEAFQNLDKQTKPRLVLEFLWRFCQENGLDIRPFEAFWRYAALLIFTSETENLVLFKELELLEGWLVQTLAQNQDEKELVAIIDDFDLFEKLVRLQLTREDYDRLKSREADVFMAGTAESLQKLMGSRIEKLDLALPGLSEDKKREILKQARHALAFYEGARKRDQAILNTLSQNTAANVPAILITGGFHTGGLTSLMQWQGIGYTVIKPKLATHDGGALYHQAMLDQNADLSAYLPAAALNKQEALYLKMLLEVAAPMLWDRYHIPHTQIGTLLAETINRHPVLSQRLNAGVEQTQAGSKLNLTLLERQNWIPTPAVRLIEAQAVAVQTLNQEPGPFNYVATYVNLPEEPEPAATFTVTIEPEGTRFSITSTPALVTDESTRLEARTIEDEALIVPDVPGTIPEPPPAVIDRLRAIEALPPEALQVEDLIEFVRLAQIINPPPNLDATSASMDPERGKLRRSYRIPGVEQIFNIQLTMGPGYGNRTLHFDRSQGNRLIQNDFYPGIAAPDDDALLQIEEVLTAGRPEARDVTLPPGNLQFEEFPDANVLAEQVARRIADVVRTNPRTVLGLATGGTVEPIYEALIRIAEGEPDLDFSQVRTFNLDEYEGLGPQNDQSYRFFMESHLFEPLRQRIGARAFLPGNTYVFDGLASDPEAEVQRYTSLIDNAEGIEFQLLGIGRDGHFAFLEPAVVIRDGQWDAARARDFNDFIFDAESLPEETIASQVTDILLHRDQTRRTLGADAVLRDQVHESHTIFHQNAALPRDDAALTAELNALGERFIAQQETFFFIPGWDAAAEQRIRELVRTNLAQSPAGQTIGLGSLRFLPKTSFFELRARRVSIALPTVLDNSRYFENLSQVPLRAFTLTGQVLSADEIVLAATGPKKSQAIADTLSRPVTPEISSTVLQQHPNTRIVTDPPAAALIPSAVRAIAEANRPEARDSTLLEPVPPFLGPVIGPTEPIRGSDVRALTPKSRAVPRAELPSEYPILTDAESTDQLSADRVRQPPLPAASDNVTLDLVVTAAELEHILFPSLTSTSTEDTDIQTTHVFSTDQLADNLAARETRQNRAALPLREDQTAVAHRLGDYYATPATLAAETGRTVEDVMEATLDALLGNSALDPNSPVMQAIREHAAFLVNEIRPPGQAVHLKSIADGADFQADIVESTLHALAIWAFARPQDLVSIFITDEPYDVADDVDVAKLEEHYAEIMEHLGASRRLTKRLRLIHVQGVQPTLLKRSILQTRNRNTAHMPVALIADDPRLLEFYGSSDYEALINRGDKFHFYDGIILTGTHLRERLIHQLQVIDLETFLDTLGLEGDAREDIARLITALKKLSASA